MFIALETERNRGKGFLQASKKVYANEAITKSTRMQEEECGNHYIYVFTIKTRMK